MSLETGTALLKAEQKGHVVTLTLANPPANVFTLESLRALPLFLNSLAKNKDVFSLIITGDGPKFFSAGADLKVFREGDTPTARQMSAAFGAAFESLTNFRGLTVAALNGYTMGGGLECALACDFRIAEAQAQLALPEAAVGLLPCGCGTQLLPALVGEPWAKRLILLGERVSAETALTIGLVDEVVPAEQAFTKALELVAKVENQSPTSITASKRLIQSARGGKPLSARLGDERESFVRLFESEDQKKAPQPSSKNVNPPGKTANHAPPFGRAPSPRRPQSGPSHPERGGDAQFAHF